jgi:hypothetical protein
MGGVSWSAKSRKEIALRDEPMTMPLIVQMT